MFGNKFFFSFSKINLTFGQILKKIYNIKKDLLPIHNLQGKHLHICGLAAAIRSKVMVNLIASGTVIFLGVYAFKPQVQF